MLGFFKGKSKDNIIYSPCKGKVVPITEVSDPTFSEKVLGDEFAVIMVNLHQIRQNLYVDMMPLKTQMTGGAKGLAGLGALFYVAYRVWQSLARAEPIDVFPLLRPFALGLCIMFFPILVLGTLNSVMSPIVT